MALSNKFDSLLLTTGNKSELAVGYCTIYGDMSGGLAVISDVPKTMVYAVARWLNGQRGADVVPRAILDKLPSAELRPGSVVVDIYAVDARTAAAAAHTIVPINVPGAPEAPLPAALPDTGFNDMPLPTQVPLPHAPARPARSRFRRPRVRRPLTPARHQAAGAPRSSCASARTCAARRR